MAVDAHPSRIVVITPSSWRILKHRLTALHLFFVGWVISMPVFYFQSPLPGGNRWAGIFLSSVLLSFSLLLIVMGFRTLFGRLPKLLLDPETRQAHLDWAWPKIWPRETIAFDDFLAAGVQDTKSREDRIVLPYIWLLHDRKVVLWYSTDNFRDARDIAERICQITGAQLGHVDAEKKRFRQKPAEESQRNFPSSR